MAAGANSKPGPSRRRYVPFTRWRRAHFFRVLEETGHAQMAAEAAGASLSCIYRLRRVEAGFAEKMRAAVEAADRRLEADEEEGQSQATVPSALVIRRGREERLRVMEVGARWWTERDDAAFFAHLRATGNVAASARAAGFTPKSAWNRRERLPGDGRGPRRRRPGARVRADGRGQVRRAEARRRSRPGDPDTSVSAGIGGGRFTGSGFRRRRRSRR